MGRSIKVGTAMIVTDNEATISYIREIRSYPKLGREEEARLFEDGSIESRSLIVKSNLRFVTQVAAKYQGRGVPLEDLIAFGRIGLISALDIYDISRGTRFMTCAAWHIRAEIQKALGSEKGFLGLEEEPEAEAERSAIDKQDFRTELRSALGSLKPREREALERFYGIGREYAQTMDQIARDMGVGEERARQMVRRAERSLREMENIGSLRKWL